MRKFVSRVCLLLIVFLSPVLVHATGLGRLTVNSGLGQPFKAEIDLVTVKKEEKSSLTVRLAPQEIFRQANIDYVPLLSTFKASIESRSDGNPYIRIISPQPISEPLLNILIELNWPSGRVLREYTVVLAPPEINAHPSVTPVSQTHLPAPVKAESIASEQPDIPVISSVTGENPATPGSASVRGIHTVYGPVKYGDTLAGIVKNIVPPFGVSFNQMLVAVHRANRDAFFGNNMHQLKTGPILRVPGNSEIGAITAEEADREVKIQTVDWNRRKMAEVVGAAKELKQTDTGQMESAADLGTPLVPSAAIFPQAGLIRQPNLAKSIRAP
ncbi:MAG: FimV/HubP family polar landmark protein [Nitrosospira sp.]